MSNSRRRIRTAVNAAVDKAIPHTAMSRRIRTAVMVGVERMIPLGVQTYRRDPVTTPDLPWDGWNVPVDVAVTANGTADVWTLCPGCPEHDGQAHPVYLFSLSAPDAARWKLYNTRKQLPGHERAS